MKYGETPYNRFDANSNPFWYTTMDWRDRKTYLRI
jgi:hypothetical protein